MPVIAVVLHVVALLFLLLFVAALRPPDPVLPVAPGAKMSFVRHCPTASLVSEGYSPTSEKSTISELKQRNVRAASAEGPWTSDRGKRATGVQERNWGTV